MDEKTKTRILMMNEDEFAYYLTKLYDKIVAEKQSDPVWVGEKRALEILGLRSKTSLWTLRKNFKIGWSKMGKVILYRTETLYSMIEAHEQKPLI